MDVPRRTRFADTEMIDGFEAEAHDLLVHILRLSPDEVFISDESALSDFSGCGLPDGIEYASLDEEHRAWKTWVLERIQACYGVGPADTDVLLVELFADIRQVRLQGRH